MVRIGVSGHRQLANPLAVSKRADEALRKIKATFGNDVLTLISPLAEGADQVVAWRALTEYQVELVVPLPFDLPDYMDDFKSVSSQAEFITLLEQAEEVIELPNQDNREASYLAAGMYVLDHSDVLIAVWDGSPAQGRGGTAEIVAEARRREMPIAWIQTERGTKKAGHSIRLHYERFPPESNKGESHL